MGTSRLQSRPPARPGGPPRHRSATAVVATRWGIIRRPTWASVNERTAGTYRVSGRGSSQIAVELAGRDQDTHLAASIKDRLSRGEIEEARAQFDELVSRHQRRASRIAFHYLRDVAEADEAVQDAFVKVFLHLSSYREDLPFEVWFTRIVVNGCLDRLKARARRERWIVSSADSPPEHAPAGDSAADLSPEERLLARERRERVQAAIGRLPERQRTVVLLSQIDGRSAKEIALITGLNESTVRVHLFRALRTLRRLLRHERWLVERATTVPGRGER
jgi:RNA polymerase sigma-70 factor (ECF subfamily)